MRLSWQDFSDWYNGRVLREQVLVLCGIVSIVFMIWKALFLNSLLESQSGMDNQLTFAAKQLEMLKKELIDEKAKPNPADELRKKILTTENEITQIDQKIGNFTENLISPVEMAKALKTILNDTEGLSLTNIQSQPSEKLINSTTKSTSTTEKDKDPALDGDVQLYRHGMSIDFIGDYIDTYHYLVKLEHLKWQLLWDSVKFSIEKHPDAKVSVIVHTLSDREAWIGA